MPRLHRSLIIIAIGLSLVALHFAFQREDVRVYAGDKVTAARVWSGYKSAHDDSLGGSASSGTQAAASGGHAVEFDLRGFTTYDESSGQHPILSLIERGKRIAAAQRARIEEVESVDDAVDDYTAAFGMAPPRGFESWYNFATSIKPIATPLPSLIPLAHRAFVPLLGFSGATMRERVAKLRESERSGMYILTLVPDGTGDIGTACTADQEWSPGHWHERGQGRVKVGGATAYDIRCNHTLELMLPMLPSLPEEIFHMDPPFEMAFSMDDGPRFVTHDSFLSKTLALAKAGKTWSASELAKAERDMGWTYGWKWICPDDSPFNLGRADTVLNDVDGALVDQSNPTTAASRNDGTKTFIADFAASADFCNNPELFPLHNMLLLDETIAAQPMIPVISSCTLTKSTDIAGVALDAVWEQMEFVPWSGKTISKAFWRGSTTGLYHKKGSPWRQSQRERLHYLAQNTSDAAIPVLIDRTAEGRGVVTESYPLKELNEKWIDAGLSGGPVQCNEEDGTCEEMLNEINFLDRVQKGANAAYKYVLDLDGNAWSSRFRRLLLGNNVVIKSTLFPEWFSETLIPWYHYVPLKVDYTDLYDILAFFNGAPDGSTPGRDDLAEEIAKNGLDFANKRWRTHDMQSYMYLVTLEYWRLLADDRNEYSYSQQ